MAIHIDRLEAEMEVLPEAPAQGPSQAGPPDLDFLRTYLRPLVLEIIEEELERLRRERY
jgi:hypothetical protein